jgi:uncharacterized protein (TIGR03066 family)
MKTLALVCAGFLCLASSAAGQDKAALGGRAWKVIKSEEAPPGTEFLFGTDNTVTVKFTVDGKDRVLNGTYSLSGPTLTLKLTHDGRERVDTRTIRKLTATSMTLEDKNRKVEELSR